MYCDFHMHSSDATITFVNKINYPFFLRRNKINYLSAHDGQDWIELTHSRLVSSSGRLTCQQYIYVAISYIDLEQ